MSNVISVTQFNNYVHSIFVAEEILQNIAVFGEVSSASMSGGNLYFSIKDDGAVLNCVRFGAAGGLIPREGEQVLVIGSPNYYVKGGKFTFNVVKIQPYGQGMLYQQFLEMKGKLEAKGLFDPQNKIALPEIIRRVGVVTSETGAVIQDIIDIAGRRNPMLDIVLYPAKVQGVGAVNTIIAGLRALDRWDVDVIILARGGGSAEDLSTFNDEKLAYAIFETGKPVISAVGHETDFTIADFVADLRAPTPSAAAELVAVNLSELKNDLVDYSSRLLNLTAAFFENSKFSVDNAAARMLNAANSTVENKLVLLTSWSNSMNHCVSEITHAKEHDLEILANRLENINPIRILRMGYSQVRLGDRIVNSTRHVHVGDRLELCFCDGMINCVVENKSEEKL